MGMRNSILEQKHPPDNQRSGAGLDGRALRRAGGEIKVKVRL